MRAWNQQGVLEKVLLLALAGMAVLFLPVYLILSRQLGVEYCGALLLRHDQGETVSYSGKARGQRVEFQVSREGAVTYLVDGQARGPYTVVLDPSAPDGLLTQGEVRLGETVLFRGSWLLDVDPIYVEDESGQLRLDLMRGEGAGEEPLPQDPSPAFLLQLILDPELHHRGQWELYAMGTVLALMTGLLVVYADRLFRWNLRWHIRDPERAEPSDWELFTRKLSWVVLSGLALVSYIMGAVIF